MADEKVSYGTGEHKECVPRGWMIWGIIAIIILVLMIFPGVFLIIPALAIGSIAAGVGAGGTV